MNIRSRAAALLVALVLFTTFSALAERAPADRVAVPEPTEKALRYHHTGNLWWVTMTIWGFIVPAAILFTGLSSRMRELAQRLGRKWFFVIAIYATLFNLLFFIVDLPFSYYLGYVRQHAYGLSNQTFAKWATDMAKGLGVNLIATPLYIWIPFLLLRKSPRRWWFYTGLATFPLMTIVLLVVPIWVDPLFNDFGPMKNKALEAKILNLADRAGIDGARVFEVNKSVDTKTVNAYVTGVSGTKRIVLWDTIIQKLDQDELLFVMGHEMGHYVLKHVAQIILFSGFVVMIGLYAVHRTAQWLIERYRARFGFTELSDVASLPLIALLFGAATFVLTPLLLTVTRHNEREADRFGLEVTRANRAAATAFVKLQQENLGVPRPALIYKIWRASHPSVAERIEFCNEYRPWEEGKPGKYADYIRE